MKRCDRHKVIERTHMIEESTSARDQFLLEIAMHLEHFHALKKLSEFRIAQMKAHDFNEATELSQKHI